MHRDLTIITSFHTDVDPVRRQQQSDALESWRALECNIVAFNKESGWPACSHIEPTQNPPTVKEMLDWYSPDRGRADEGTLILVNSDIVLTKDVLGILKMNDQLGRMWAATSLRRETENGVPNGKIDWGLDFFAMTKTMASRVAHDIPPFLTVGRGLWDNWVNGWLKKNLPPQRYFDITDWECVFHPKHDRVDGRLSGYTQEQTDQVLKHLSIQPGGVPPVKFLKQT